MDTVCVRPFAGGIEYMGWDVRNCARCSKAENGCEIAEALAVACLGDGTIPLEISARLGVTESASWLDRGCPEIEMGGA